MRRLGVQRQVKKAKDSSALQAETSADQTLACISLEPYLIALTLQIHQIQTSSKPTT